MAEKQAGSKQLSMPVVGMLLLGGSGAVLTGASFAIMPYWPLPQGVDPYFGWETGAVWGAVIGAVMGLVIGFLTDDDRFDEVSYK